MASHPTEHPEFGGPPGEHSIVSRLLFFIFTGQSSEQHGVQPQQAIIKKTTATMGNFHSASLSCYVMDNPWDISPGDTLRGYVRLDVLKEKDFAMQFDSIAITVAGVDYLVCKEHDHVEIKPTSKSSIEHIISFPNKAKSNNERGSPCPLSNGTYEFPFSIQLPKRTSKDDENYGHVVGNSSAKIPVIEFSHNKSMPDLVFTGSEAELSGSNKGNASNKSAPADNQDFNASLTTSISEFSHESSATITTNSYTRKRSVFKVRARLRRKPNIPLEVDTDIWCNAEYYSSVLPL
mmetsp:Transcript_1179/g.2117  ORF Transcript_1179/g.2117 Transcript_1179/m.2117 type:complete len:292 (+) Transcript_1179:3-878(+)